MSWKSICGHGERSGVCAGVVVSPGKNSSQVPSQNARSGNTVKCKQGDREGTRTWTLKKRLSLEPPVRFGGIGRAFYRAHTHWRAADLTSRHRHREKGK